jgi:hypothetical protein
MDREKRGKIKNILQSRKHEKDINTVANKNFA